MSLRHTLLALIGSAWTALASADAAEFVMVSKADADVAPIPMRVVMTDKALSADMPAELMIDLDADGLDDLCIQLVTTVSNSSVNGIETATTLRVNGRADVDLGVSGPLAPGDIIRRSDQFYRSISLARFKGSAKAEFFFGEWTRGPGDISGVLPVRMRGDTGMYLGFLSLRLDGYGNVRRLSYAISLVPVLSLAVPQVPVLPAGGGSTRPQGHPYLADTSVRLAMN